jgi:hypothetical protein
VSPAGNSKKAAPGKPFRKGQSGNPSGRPKTDPDVKEALKAACPAAAKRLVQLSQSFDEDVALKASIAILDRTYGKPTQPVSGDDSKGPVRVVVELADLAGGGA